jgi:aryl-alcohol dehydrogenase-like predicted oxidoreductase
MTFGSPARAPRVPGEEGIAPILDAAPDHGITVFDLAGFRAVGAGQEIVGRLLMAHRAGHRLVRATTGDDTRSDDPNDRGLSRGHVTGAVDAGPRRLRTDQADLRRLHRLDPDTPPEETLDAPDDCGRAGRVCHRGASSMVARQVVKAPGPHRALRQPPEEAAELEAPYRPKPVAGHV